MKLLIHRVWLFVFALSLGLAAQAQQTYRLTDSQTKDLLKQIDKHTETYRTSLKDALKRSRFDDRRDKEINEYMKNFERSVERLRDRFDDTKSAAGVVEDVLRKGAMIDRFIATNQLAPRVQDDWLVVRNDLDQLARGYGFNWTWGATTGEAAFRYADKDVKYIVQQLDRDVVYFRSTFKKSLENNSIRSDQRRDAERYAKEFDKAIEKLKENYDNSNAGRQYAEETLRRAMELQRFIGPNLRSETVDVAWANLRPNLERLAQAYNVDWSR
jgi:hypothetical protein